MRQPFFLPFLLILAMLFGGTSASAAGEKVKCADIDAAIKKIQDNTDAEVNPLMIMIPKADCWLERTHRTMDELQTTKIIPPLALALGLLGFVTGALSAAASGVPRKLTEVAIQGVVGGVIILSSIPTPVNKNPVIPTMIMNSWIQMYVAVGTNSGERINEKVGQATDGLGYLIMNSPIAFIGFGPGVNLAGRTAVYGAKMKALTTANAAAAAKLEAGALSTLKNQRDDLVKAFEVKMEKTLDLKERSAMKIAQDDELKKLDGLIKKHQDEADSVRAGGSPASAAEAKKIQEQQAKDTALTSKTAKNTLSLGFLLVVPMLLTYAGAVYISGVMALAMALVMPMIGVAVIFGRGGMLMQVISRHLANLLVIALLPVAFTVAIDIGYVQPMIAVKGMFSSMRESMGNTWENVTGMTTAAMNLTGGLYNPLNLYKYVSQGIDFVGNLVSSLKYLVIAFMIGLIMFVGSIGMAGAILLKFPAVFANYLEGAFEHLGGDGGRLGEAAKLVTNAVFKTKK